MPLILPSNSISAGGFAVDNSLRFDDGSSDNIQRTYGTPTNSKIFGLSWWVKLGKGYDGLGSQDFWGERSGSGDRVFMGINADGTFQYFEKNGGSTILDIKTNRLFRDNSAWYHFLLLGDSTQGTSSNRLKLYINGQQETSFSTESYPSSNYAFRLAINTTKYFGRIGLGSSLSTNYYDGYLAEAVFVDGTVTAHTDYGEFDEDTGIWKPIDVSGLTFGNNGFYLDFENSGSLGADVSGNGNNFTVNNLTSIDQTTDTPTNNYATMNPLAVPPSNAPTFSEGNTKISTNTTNANPVLSTIGVSQGKWYVECKRISYDGGTGDDDGFRIGFGVTYVQDVNIVPPAISDSGHYFMIGNGIVYNGATDLGDKAGDSNVSDDGVVGIALDLDNNRISWSFNGAWMTGSNAWSGSSPSSYVSIPSGYTYFFLQTDGSSGRAYTGGWNFGGTSAFTISSGNTDENGYGNFEYAPPSGYYALNTKNLAEFG